jgi:uncharacterized membrane protein YeaQ/YmgE (transglycosylase-associated protein family)
MFAASILMEQKLYVVEWWPRGLLAWLFLGLVAGWLAGKLSRGRGYGCITDIILGLIGSFIGGWVITKLASSAAASSISLAAATLARSSWWRSSIYSPAARRVDRAFSCNVRPCTPQSQPAFCRSKFPCGISAAIALAWLLIGLIAGWLAAWCFAAAGFGCVTDIVLGLIGSVIGGWLFQLLRHYDGGIFTTLWAPHGGSCRSGGHFTAVRRRTEEVGQFSRVRRRCPLLCDTISIRTVELTSR